MVERKNNFFTQPAEKAVFCTVYSLANALILLGKEVNPGTLSKWEELIMLGDEEVSKLLEGDASAINDLLTPFEVELKYYSLLSLQGCPKGERLKKVVSDFKQILQQSPIYFFIPTIMSKRNSNVVPEITYKDLSTYKGQRVAHAVLLSKGKSDDSVEIIDPYDPDRPERFILKNEEDKQRLTRWLFSLMGYQGNEKSIEEIFKNTDQRLEKLETLEGENLENFIWLYCPKFFSFQRKS